MESTAFKTAFDAARYCEVSERTIRHWIKKGLKPNKKGLFTKNILDAYQKTRVIDGRQATKIVSALRRMASELINIAESIDRAKTLRKNR